MLLVAAGTVNLRDLASIPDDDGRPEQPRADQSQDGRRSAGRRDSNSRLKTQTASARHGPLSPRGDSFRPQCTSLSLCKKLAILSLSHDNPLTPT
mmetsp:Transcript_23440/g.51427  ORF Transcript_23440/g.51427 Transcript_23440/m.51427 type:complete len:95 (+) Transcript_23440:343-627(+)